MNPGDKLIVRMDDDGLRIENRLQSLQRAQRLMETLYGPDRDPVQELIDGRRLEAQCELDE